jgi:uncharacterized protein (DUF1810 family)
MVADVTRFVEAQARDFAQALAEIRAGRKRSHWMWYVFPQVAGLGRSSTAQRYAIASLAEARAFLDHPQLGRNYREIVAACRAHIVEQGVTIRELLGSPDDAKLVSSLTLFRAVADTDDDAGLRAEIDELLGVAERQGLPSCSVTAAFLAAAT